MREKLKLFSNSQLMNLNSTNQRKGGTYIDWSCRVEGYAMKKSKYLKNWSKKYMKISNCELRSYRISTAPAKNKSFCNDKPNSSFKVDEINFPK
jgi:hypothetical protein